MRNIFASVFRPFVQKIGFDIIRNKKKSSRSPSYPSDFDESNIKTCDIVKPYTMTSPERVNALIEAVRYIVKSEINGAIVECGVWKGGSSMAIARTLLELGDINRDIYLYDTYSGMTAPTSADVSFRGVKASETFSTTIISEDASDWCLSSLEEVKKNMLSIGYDKKKIHFIVGKVEITIPKNTPKEIALLRLDTDWYESTKHELIHLFPLLKPNGILIIDDYGHWEGARKAVDEYISDNNIRILLNRIDYSGRIAVKT